MKTIEKKESKWNLFFLHFLNFILVVIPSFIIAFSTGIVVGPALEVIPPQYFAFLLGILTGVIFGYLQYIKRGKLSRFLVIIFAGIVAGVIAGWIIEILPYTWSYPWASDINFN